MNEILVIHENTEFPVDARELHESLGVETPYRIWFPRMCEYGFEEGRDFNSDKNVRVQIEGEREVKREITTHNLTLSMAKEICMLQRTDMGRKVRRYLIDIEQAWNTPEQIMSRALRIANDTIGSLHQKLGQMAIDNSRLAVENQTMLPKAEYFDTLVDRNLLTSFRETAKEFGIKEKTFIGLLIEKKYIYRDKKGKLMPTAEKGGDLFEVKESYNEKTQWCGTQTMITTKGREVFRNMTQGM